jgi:hypothetical protein
LGRAYQWVDWSADESWPQADVAVNTEREPDYTGFSELPDDGGGDGASEEVIVCDQDCDADALTCDDCEPGESSYSDGVESLCTDDRIHAERECALGCDGDGDGARCLDFAPSNGLGAFYELADSAPSLKLAGML